MVKIGSLFICCSLFMCGRLFSQEIRISNIGLSENNTVVIHYDLQDSIVGRRYTIQVYSSQDNYLNPLEHVEGEAGLEVKPGFNKKIIWNAQKDLGTFFNGKIALELRAKIFVPFINMEGFEEIKVLKRTREYKITWTGGHPKNVLNFDLYRGKEKVLTYPNIANAGHYNLIIPAYVRPGKNYKFKISDAKNEDEVIYTEPFKIKRKIPLMAKAIPLIVLGGVGYMFFQPEEDNAISDPIRP